MRVSNETIPFMNHFDCTLYRVRVGDYVIVSNKNPMNSPTMCEVIRIDDDNNTIVAITKWGEKAFHMRGGQAVVIDSDGDDRYTYYATPITEALYKKICDYHTQAKCFWALREASERLQKKTVGHSPSEYMKMKEDRVNQLLALINEAINDMG